MKITRLVSIVCASLFVAAPGLAASPSAAGSEAPISLCGESKAKNSEKAEPTEATEKVEKKNDKKDAKEKKNDSKAAA